MSNEKDYKEIVEKAEHYKAIGQTNIHLYCSDEEDALIKMPWQFATEIREGGAYRLNGPKDARVIALHPCGLTFDWCFDFEEQNSNGRSVNLFDSQRLRKIILLLPKPAQQQFANLLETKVLETKVLEGVQELTKQIQGSLRRQAESELVLLELIAYGKNQK